MLILLMNQEIISKASQEIGKLSHIISMAGEKTVYVEFQFGYYIFLFSPTNTTKKATVTSAGVKVTVSSGRRNPLTVALPHIAL